MHTRPGFPWTRPGLGNVVLHAGCKTTVVHDVSMMNLTSCWHHFHVSFRQTFRRQRTCKRKDRTELFLIEKCSYFSIKLIKQHMFKSKCNCRRKSMQEKESIMVLRCKLKIPSLGQLFGITRQASWCRTVTLVTEVSISTSQPLKILIFSWTWHDKLLELRIYLVPRKSYSRIQDLYVSNVRKERHLRMGKLWTVFVYDELQRTRNGLLETDLIHYM